MYCPRTRPQTWGEQVPKAGSIGGWLCILLVWYKSCRANEHYFDIYSVFKWIIISVWTVQWLTDLGLSICCLIRQVTVQSYCPLSKSVTRQCSVIYLCIHLLCVYGCVLSPSILTSVLCLLLPDNLSYQWPHGEYWWLLDEIHQPCNRVAIQVSLIHCQTKMHGVPIKGKSKELSFQNSPATFSQVPYCNPV